METWCTVYKSWESRAHNRDHLGSVFAACRVMCLFFLQFLMLPTFSVVSFRVPSSWMLWRSCTLFPGSVSFHVFFPTRMAALLGFLQYYVSDYTCHIACKAHFIVIVCFRWVHTLQAWAPEWQRWCGATVSWQKGRCWVMRGSSLQRINTVFKELVSSKIVSFYGESEPGPKAF